MNVFNQSSIKHSSSCIPLLCPLNGWTLVHSGFEGCLRLFKLCCVNNRLRFTWVIVGGHWYLRTFRAIMVNSVLGYRWSHSASISAYISPQRIVHHINSTFCTNDRSHAEGSQFMGSFLPFSWWGGFLAYRRHDGIHRITSWGLAFDDKLYSNTVVVFFCLAGSYQSPIRRVNLVFAYLH